MEESREEFMINIPGVVTLHSRGRIKDICFRLQHEEKVVVKCEPVYVPERLPPSQASPQHGQQSRLKTVKCIEGDWSFIRVHHGDIASQQVSIIKVLDCMFLVHVICVGRCDCQQNRE